MGYLLDEIPIPKEYEKWHQGTIQHYNFTRSGEHTGICSHCGTGLNSSVTKCNLCGSELIPRRVTKSFNPKSKDYYQETACERIHKIGHKVLYSYYVAWTKIIDLHEKTGILEVERQFVNDPYPNVETRIRLSVARFHIGDEWHKDCKYSDYYFGTGQKRPRKIFIMVPDNYREFLSDTEAKYTCLGEFMESKFTDNKPHPTYFIGQYWASLNWSYNEFIWKSGFKKLYEAILDGLVDRRMISKNIMKEMRKDLLTIGDPSVDEFMILREVHKNRLNFKVSEIKGLTLNMVELLPKAMKLTGASQSKCWRYMKEVCIGDAEDTCGRYGGRTHAHVRKEWIDYLEMVREIEGAIEGKKAFPEDPKKAHDDILRIKNAMKNELRAKAQIENAEKNGLVDMLRETIEEYQLEKLEYTDPKSGLMIVAMKSIKDIVDEGALMNHCVGGIGYIEGMAQAKSFIFSMRKIDEPNIPVGTIEYKIGIGVVQCQGYDNKSRNLPKGYQDTLDQWQQHINEVRAWDDFDRHMAKVRA